MLTPLFLLHIKCFATLRCQIKRLNKTDTEEPYRRMWKGESELGGGGGESQSKREKKSLKIAYFQVNLKLYSKMIFITNGLYLYDCILPFHLKKCLKSFKI